MTPNWVDNRDVSEIAGGHSASQADILLIEDDDAIARMYELGLNLKGLPVRIAGSGEAALTEIDSDVHFSAVILDLELPWMSGIQVLDELRHRPSTVDVPVIVLSNQDFDAGDLYQHGATECHAKYWTTPRDLARYVEGAIHHVA